MTQSSIVRWSNPRVILVATNLLEGNGFSLHAINQARLSNSKVLLVHVIQSCLARTESMDEMPTIVPLYQVVSPLAKLNEMADAFQRAGIDCDQIVLRGNPEKQIPLLVKARSVDRVIVSNRNMSGVSRFLEGSVAEELIGTLEVPVCVIGRRARPDVQQGTPLRRILVATSFEPVDELIVAFASTLAEFNGAHLTVLHVLDSARMSGQERELARFASRKRLLELIPKEARHRDQPLCVVREGDPAEIIAFESRSTSQDLLILGSPYPSVLSWLLGTSVVHRVIVDSPCPVVTIRPRDPIDEFINAAAAERPVDQHEYA